MKATILLALFAIAVSTPFINRKFVNHLKKIAPFEVYEPEENRFRDWTREEIKKILPKSRRPFTPPRKVEYHEENPDVEEFDFRQEYPECVLGVRNEEACGASYAISTADALGNRFCMHSEGRMTTKLSAQDIVSCDTDDYGCDGGEMLNVWAYVTAVGIVSDTCFPFKSEHGEVKPCITECEDGTEWKKYKAADYLFAHNIQQMKDFLVERGPLMSYFTVYEDFMNYKGGIYEHVSGEEQGGRYVSIIGFGNEGLVHFWICQNSWGPEWGESGYFRIKFGECGIDYEAMSGNPLL